MSFSYNPKLCGATFFCILLQSASPQLSARDKWQANSNNVTQPNMFQALIKIANPEISANFNSDSFDKTLCAYKKCKLNESRTYFPLCDVAFKNDFNERVMENFEQVRQEMVVFIQKFIDHTNTSKMKKLVGTLQELIENDDEVIRPFFMGRKISKKEFTTATNVDLGAFLLAVWHHIVVWISDNKKGLDTITAWADNNFLIEMGFAKAKKLTVDFNQQFNREISFETLNTKEQLTNCNNLLEQVKTKLNENAKVFAFNDFKDCETKIIIVFVNSQN